MSHEQLQQMTEQADKISGRPSFWMPFRHASDKKLMALDGHGGWRSEVCLLRAVDAGKEVPFTLTFAGTEGSARVVCIHLFKPATDKPVADSIAGLEISGAAQTSQVKTYRFAIPNQQTAIPGTVYLEARDAAGNPTAPIPVNGRTFGTTLGNLP